MSSTQRGRTPSERYIAQLSQKAFLNLWSYSNVHKKPNNELSDLLVIFGDDVILFEVKSCQFKDTGKLEEVDWPRWFGRAVWKAADKLFRAERWIRLHPSEVYEDVKCEKQVPVPIPELRTARFHRIVIASGAMEACRGFWGGRGSLMIRPDIVGKLHMEIADDGDCRAFAVGQIDPARGHIHVFTPASINLVLGELDTVSDFVAYLRIKERAIANGQLQRAASEEDLLAYAIKSAASHGVLTIATPPGQAGVIVSPGEWDRFVQSAHYKRAKMENKISYEWDANIQHWYHEIESGIAKPYTDLTGSAATFSHVEEALRVMAKEDRVSRKILCQQINSLLKRTPPNSSNSMVSPHPLEPQLCYAFMIEPFDLKQTLEQQATHRARHLEALCRVAKLHDKRICTVVGFSFAPKPHHKRGLQALWFDFSDWSNEDYEFARWISQQTGILKNAKQSSSVVERYPGMKMTQNAQDFADRVVSNMAEGRVSAFEK